MKHLVTCKNCAKEEFVFPSRASNYTYCSKDCMSESFSKLPKFKLGQLINKWAVIENKPFRLHGRYYITVKCICGSDIEERMLVKTAINKKSIGCRDCSRGQGYKGYEGISGEYWSLLKHGAQKRNIEFKITKEEAWELFLKQNKKCKLSNIQIHFQKDSSRTNRKRNFSRTASLDRIDSTKGYVIDNIQWLHKDVNMMKNKFSQEYFIDTCKKICKTN